MKNLQSLHWRMGRVSKIHPWPRRHSSVGRHSHIPGHYQAGIQLHLPSIIYTKNLKDWSSRARSMFKPYRFRRPAASATSTGQRSAHRRGRIKHYIPFSATTLFIYKTSNLKQHTHTYIHTFDERIA